MYAMEPSVGGIASTFADSALDTGRRALSEIGMGWSPQTSVSTKAGRRELGMSWAEGRGDGRRCPRVQKRGHRARRGLARRGARRGRHHLGALGHRRQLPHGGLSGLRRARDYRRVPVHGGIDAQIHVHASRRGSRSLRHQLDARSSRRGDAQPRAAACAEGHAVREPVHSPTTCSVCVGHDGDGRDHPGEVRGPGARPDPEGPVLHAVRDAV